jgi:hypothetical protein
LTFVTWRGRGRGSNGRAMANELIAHMRARVDQCRRLANMITDEKAASVLRKMAEDGEADIARLEAEEAAGNGQQQGSPPAAFT